MNVVRWRREGLFDRRFLAICNDAFLYVALLDNSGLISNQTLVASYTFDPFISTAPVPGGVVGCAPHFGADGNVAIWATVNDGFRGSPQSGTYVYKMSPISTRVGLPRPNPNFLTIDRLFVFSFSKVSKV